MKIGIDYRMGGNINAGIGRYISELLREILKQDPKSSYVVFYNAKNFSKGDIAELGKYSNVELVATNARHYSLQEQTSFLKILNSHKLDLVHFPNFNTPYFYKRPFVVTIHDMVHHKISGHKKSHFLHFQAYKKIIENAGHKAKKVITVSQAAKKDIQNILKLKQEQIQVVYEGPSLVPATDEKITEVKKTYLLTRPYFLFVGTLERKKNIIGLARAFDVFLEKYNLDMDLVIAGKADSHYPEIKYEAMKIKHKDRLIFTGYVQDAELAALYGGAYAFVSASLHEGFGLPGLEALAVGLPLLVSNSEVFNEIYDNAAIYFDPQSPEDIAEKMRLLVEDPQFYAQLQEKSVRRSQNFSWEKAARETLEVYQKAISS